MCTSPWFSFSSTRSTNQGASIPRICRYNSRSCILGLSHPEIVTHYKAGIPSLVKTHDNSAVRYTRVTYREGNLQAARFSRDGQTIVYSGGWEGEPPQVAIARLGSPESRPLGIPPAGIAAVSSSDELAVLRSCDFVYLNNCIG